MSSKTEHQVKNFTIPTDKMFKTLKSIISKHTVNKFKTEIRKFKTQ